MRTGPKPENGKQNLRVTEAGAQKGKCLKCNHESTGKDRGQTTEDGCQQKRKQIPEDNPNHENAKRKMEDQSDASQNP